MLQKTIRAFVFTVLGIGLSFSSVGYASENDNAVESNSIPGLFDIADSLLAIATLSLDMYLDASKQFGCVVAPLDFNLCVSCTVVGMSHDQWSIEARTCENVCARWKACLPFSGS